MRALPAALALLAAAAPPATAGGDPAGITVGPVAGTVRGGTAGVVTFAIALDTAPAADVTLGVISSEPARADVHGPGVLVFTPAAWWEAQTVSISAVDACDAGATCATSPAAVTIHTTPADSTDPEYHGVNPPDVRVPVATGGGATAGDGVKVTGACRVGDTTYLATNRGLGMTTQLSAGGVDGGELDEDAIVLAARDREGTEDDRSGRLGDVPGYTIRVSCRERIRRGVLPTVDAARIYDLCAHETTTADGPYPSDSLFAGATSTVATFARGYDDSTGVYFDPNAFPTFSGGFTMALWWSWRGGAAAMNGYVPLLNFGGAELRVWGTTTQLQVKCGVGLDAPYQVKMVSWTLNDAGAWRTTHAFHMACVRRDTGDALELYVDGQLVATEEYDDRSYGREFRLVEGLGGIYPLGQEPFAFDDVRLYTHALSHTEVRAIGYPDAHPRAPVAAVHCEPSAGTVYYAPDLAALPRGACRAMAFDVATGTTAPVRQSCPVAAAPLAARTALAHGTTTSLVRVGAADLVLAGPYDRWAVFSVNRIPRTPDGMDPRPIPAAAGVTEGTYVRPGDYVCHAADGATYSVLRGSGAVYRVHGIFEDDPTRAMGALSMTEVVPADHDGFVAPAYGCAAATGGDRIFIADAGGVREVVLATARGRRVHGTGATSYTGVSVNADDGMLTAVSAGGGRTVLVSTPDAAGEVTSRVVFGQAGGGGDSDRPPASNGYTDNGVYDPTSIPRGTILARAVMESQSGGGVPYVKRCAVECDSMAACRMYLVDPAVPAGAADGWCYLLGTNDTTGFASGTAQLWLKTAIAAEIPRGTDVDGGLSAVLSGEALGVIPHGMCGMGGWVYISGGGQLHRVHLASRRMEHIVGGGNATGVVDGPVDPSQRWADGALACRPPNMIYAAQAARACVLALNLTDFTVSTAAGVCDTPIADGVTPSYTASVAAATAIAAPAHISLHPLRQTLYVAVPSLYIVYAVDLAAQTMKAVAGRAATAGTAPVSHSTTPPAITAYDLRYPCAAGWVGGLTANDASSVLVYDGAPARAPHAQLLKTMIEGVTPSYRAVAGEDSAAWTGLLDTRVTVARAGGVMTPANNAYLSGSFKGGLVVVGRMAYIPAALHPDGVVAVDLHTGELSRPPAPFPSGREYSMPQARGHAPLTGVALGEDHDGRGLFVGGVVAGTPVVYHVRGDLPSGAVRLTGGALTVAAFNGFATESMGMAMSFQIRVDAALPASHFMCVVNYGTDAGFTAGVARGSRGDDDGHVFLAVNGKYFAVPAAGILDGLWHHVRVAWSPVPSEWYITVDGHATSSPSAPAAFTLVAGQQLQVGCSDRVSSDVGPGALYWSNTFSVREVILTDGFVRVHAPLPRAAAAGTATSIVGAWPLETDTSDRSGHEADFIAGASVAFTNGPATRRQSDATDAGAHPAGGTAALRGMGLGNGRVELVRFGEHKLRATHSDVAWTADGPCGQALSLAVGGRAEIGVFDMWRVWVAGGVGVRVSSFVYPIVAARDAWGAARPAVAVGPLSLTLLETRDGFAPSARLGTADCVGPVVPPERWALLSAYYDLTSAAPSVTLSVQQTVVATCPIHVDEEAFARMHEPVVVGGAAAFNGRLAGTTVVLVKKVTEEGGANATGVSGLNLTSTVNASADFEYVGEEGCAMRCRDGLEGPLGAAHGVRGAHGVAMWDGVTRFTAGGNQYLSAPASPSPGGVSGHDTIAFGGWMQLSSDVAANATSRLLYGIPAATAAPPGAAGGFRMCVDEGYASYGMGAAAVSMSSGAGTASGPADAKATWPHADRPRPDDPVGSCGGWERTVFTRGDVAPVWSRGAAYAAWVRVARYHVAAEQPILHFTTSEGTQHIAVVLEPAEADHQHLLGQWCVDPNNTFADAFADGNDLLPLDAAVNTTDVRDIPGLSRSLMGASRVVCDVNATGAGVTPPSADTKSTAGDSATFATYIRVAPEAVVNSTTELAAVAFDTPGATDRMFLTLRCVQAYGMCHVFWHVATSTTGGTIVGSASVPEMVVPVGQWVHLAVAYDSSTMSQDPLYRAALVVYVDGDEVHRGFVKSGFPIGDATRITLGGTVNDGRGIAAAFHDTRLYGVVLSQSAVARLRDGSAAVRVGVTSQETAGATAPSTCLAQHDADDNVSFPLNEWVHVTVQFREGGVWVTTDAAAVRREADPEYVAQPGDIAVTTCSGLPMNVASGIEDITLDAVEVGWRSTSFHRAGGAVTSSRMEVYDLRVLNTTLPETAPHPEWVTAPPWRAWRVRVGITPSNRLEAVYNGRLLTAAPGDTPCEAAALVFNSSGWIHFAVGIAADAEKGVTARWWRGGTLVCEQYAPPPQATGGRPVIAHTPAAGTAATMGYIGGHPGGLSFDGFLSAVFVWHGALPSLGALEHMMDGNPAAAPAACDVAAWFPMYDVNATAAADASEHAAPRAPGYDAASDAWWGLTAAPSLSLSFSAVRSTDPLAVPAANAPGVFLGSDDASGARWAEGLGAAADDTHACRRPDTVLFDFPFDSRPGTPSRLASGPGAYAPNYLEGSGMGLVAGVSGGALAYEGRASVVQLGMAAGGTGVQGMTLAFWVRHARPSAGSSSTSAGDTRADDSIYQILREGAGGEAGRAVLAFATPDGAGVYYRIDLGSAVGVYGPTAADAHAHIPFGEWHHVAIVVAPNTAEINANAGGAAAARFYVNGRLVNTTAIAAGGYATPWAWDAGAPVLSRYRPDYDVHVQQTCGDGTAALEQAMADGSAGGYLTGGVDACKVACDANAVCNGFVYITGGGDAAPAGRCYFRSTAEVYTGYTTRTCYMKNTREYPTVVVDDLTVWRHPLHARCVDAVYATHSERGAETSAPGAARPVPEANDPPSASCRRGVPRADVAAHFPMLSPMASATQTTAVGYTDRAPFMEKEAEGFAGGLLGSRAAVVPSAYLGYNASTGGRTLDDAGADAIKAFGGGSAAVFGADAGVFLAPGCFKMRALNATPAAGTSGVIATVAGAAFQNAAPHALRVRARNPAASVGITIGVGAADGTRWAEVVVRPNTGDWMWYEAVGVYTGAAADNVVTYTTADAAHALEVDAVHVCGVAEQTGGAAWMCEPWGCDCTAAAAFWGDCADDEVRAWYAATCGAVYSAASTPGVHYPGCTATPAARGYTVAFNVYINATAEGVAAAAVTVVGTTCRVVRRLAASMGDPAAPGAWAWYLCAGAAGGVRVEATRAAQAAAYAYHTTDTPELPLMQRVHLAVVTSPTERKLYVNGALVFREEGAHPPVRWAPSARFFDAGGGAGVAVPLWVSDLIVFQGTGHCDSVYARIARGGGTSVVALPTPCALGSGRGAAYDGDGPMPDAYLKFDDAWTQPHPHRTEPGHPSALVEEGGRAFRVGSVALSAAERPASADLAAGALTLAFWLKVDAAGRGDGSDAMQAVVNSSATDVAFGVVVCRTGPGAAGDQEIVVGAAGDKVLLGARYHPAGGAPPLQVVLQPDESTMRVGAWHHMVVVLELPDVGAPGLQLFTDGAHTPAAALNTLPAGWGALSWTSPDWLAYANDTAHAGGSETAAYVDNLAVYGRALTAAEAARAYLDQVGWVDLGNGTTAREVEWTMGEDGAQTWAVDGHTARRCPASAGLIDGSGALRVGRGPRGTQFFGTMSDTVLTAPAKDHPGRVADLDAPLATPPDAIPASLLFAQRPYNAVAYTIPTPAPVVATPAPAFFYCTGCSDDCDAPCHDSHYTFDVPGGLAKDMTGNERHAVVRGVPYDSRGMYNTKALRHTDGEGSVVFASLDVDAWSAQLANAAQLAFSVWMNAETSTGGLVFSVVDRETKALAAALYSRDGGKFCVDVLGTSCCTGGGKREVGDWQHVAFATRVSWKEVETEVWVGGVTETSCLQALPATSKATLPALPHAAMFESHEDVFKRVVGLGAFNGSVDDVKLATAWRAPDENLSPSCADCAPCDAVDRSNIESLFTRNWDMIDVFARSPTTPFGHTALVVAPLDTVEGGANATCGVDVSAGESVQLGTLLYTGAVDLMADFAAPGCVLRCDAYARTAVAVGCDAERVVATAFTEIHGGWWHCSARMVANTTGRVTGGITVGTQAVLPGFGYGVASRCGNGIVDYPAEVCDPRGPDTGVPCDRRLCTPVRGAPAVASATLTMAFTRDVLTAAEGSSEFTIAVSFDPGRPLPVRPRAFLSHFANCSDPDDHHIVVLNEDGFASIPTIDAAFAFTAPTDIHACVAAGHDGFVSAASREGLPCKLSCRGAGWCDVFAGECVCVRGLSGADCTEVDSTCDARAADGDDADCDDAAALLQTRASCEPSSCEDNGGTCAGQGLCICPIGFAPPHCNRCLPGYAGNACLPVCDRVCHHGACVYIADHGPHCACDRGWRGADCGEPFAVFQQGAGGGGVAVTADGRSASVTAGAPQVKRLVLAFPEVSASGAALEFSVETSPGVVVGVCSAGEHADATVGGDVGSWGVELGDITLAHHNAVSRPLGISATSVRLQLNAATSTLTLTRLDPQAASGVQVFSQVCPDGDCYGCATVNEGGFVRLI